MQPDVLIGRQLGDYHIEARIGRGGMAKIYRAYQPSVQRHVAIKIISTDVADEQDLKTFHERFAREAQVVASLEHTHILPIYDYGLVDETAYLVMRLMSGGSLSDMVMEGPLPQERAAEIFSQVARGLAYAHSKGIIHRDLKPANILFSSTGDAYLTDFGLAKWIEGSPILTQSGKIVGTPAYMAPEQLRGDPIDQRADIYSMGIILYQMLTGELPFDSDSGDVVSIMYQHLEKQPPSPRDINPEISPTVEAVILKALEKHPVHRYSSILQMADELDAALGRRLASKPGDMSPTPVVIFKDTVQQAQQRARRRWIIGGAAAIIALVLVVVAALALTHSQTLSIPPPTIQAGVVAPASEVIPTEQEVARAQQALGDGLIAYITCNQSSEYHATQAREMGDFASSYGLAYRVYDSDTSSYNQLTQIERARTDGARALIICPLDPDLLDEPLRAVQNAGMPLVILSGNLQSYGGVLLVGDEYQMGYKAGQLAGQIIAEEMNGEANVILLDYPDLPYIVTRADGMEEGVLSEAPQANIVGRYRGATPEFGEASVAELLRSDVDFNVIVSINDAGAFGAIRALEAFNIAPEDVIITSIDAEQLARRYISDDYYMRGSVEVGREQFSRAAIHAMVRLLAGGTLPERILVPPGDIVTAETEASETQDE